MGQDKLWQHKQDNKKGSDSSLPFLYLSLTLIRRVFSLASVIAIADLLEEVKTETSKWIKTKGPEFRNFHWQKGYGAFSIGQSQVGAVKQYIHSQKEHHRRVTFQEEYREFLKAYGIDYDERSVWD